MAAKDVLTGEAKEKKIQQIRGILENTYGKVDTPRIYCIMRRSSARRGNPTRSLDVYCIDYHVSADGLSIPNLHYLNGDIAALWYVRRNRHQEIVISGAGFSAEQEIADLLSYRLYGELGKIKGERL